ncbi:stalk domain-containing protein [Mangrovibacillus cuniculi]|uniref:Copper amine oxidase-like N-terminal domain-containing protein n=1 Tax=Mangrovibacillus cuniculi TaxID=2593652 RepID=A0A7S8CA52_9BACI|nr:stalk domain-containing protein [Mangrovibacillus cuniculi]QPC46232.1 hypothetical protein G8O30_04295 [Mangrovibacillus cuniculi]
MNRLSLFMTALLLVTIGAFSYLQWTSYQDVNGGYAENKVVWEFSVVHDNNVLTIEQYSQDVPAGVYTVNWPEDTLDVQCMQEEAICEWDSESKETVNITDSPVLFTYVIPLSNKETEGIILRDWSVMLEEVKTKEVTISITQRQYRDGVWIAALGTNGKVSKELITFYEYQGDFVSPLVFHPTSLQVNYIGSDLTIWSEKEVDIPQEKDDLLLKEDIKLKPISLIVSNELELFESERLLVVSSEENLIELREKRISQWMQSKWKDDAKWQSDIFVADVLGVDLPSSKRKNMKNELEATLTPKQYEALISSIFTAPKNSINPVALDEFVHDIVGQETNFFTVNANGDVPLVPFFTRKDKPLTYQGSELEGISVQYFRNKPVVPFEEFLKEIGYEVTQVSQESAYILERGGNRYRFFTNQNIFILNEEDYGLLENPLLRLGDTIYIETGWLEQFFSITVEENETNYEVVGL